MSRHNYSQYSNKNHNNAEDATTSTTEETTIPYQDVAPEVDEVVTVTGIDREDVVETVETVTLPAAVTGVVANCARLNVRAAAIPNATVLCVIDAGSEVQIDTSRSDNDWVYVTTANGVEGYCMRQFVEASL